MASPVRPAAPAPPRRRRSPLHAALVAIVLTALALAVIGAIGIGIVNPRPGAQPVRVRRYGQGVAYVALWVGAVTFLYVRWQNRRPPPQV